MSTKTTAKIKICGLYREEDIHYVNLYRPDFIGFIFWPKSHRYVDKEKALQLSRLLKRDDKGDAYIKRVGVFVDEDINTIADIACSDIIDIIQLHGNEDESVVEILKQKTQLPVIKAVKIKSGFEEEAALEIKRWDASAADYLLLDSGMGTGKPFDWGKADVRPVKPFFLAGGINADNICEAADIFKPYAIDLSSSVETDKKKDEAKIRAVINALRA